MKEKTIYKKKFSEASEILKINDSIIDSIDVKPLEKEITKRLGVNIKISLEVWEGRGANSITFKRDKNLVKNTGIFEYLLKDCFVKVFNTSIGKNEKENDVWWATVSLDYSQKEHGSNGMEFLTLWYNFEDKKWTFK